MQKTLRDEFAMAALQGYLHAYPDTVEYSESSKEMATKFYRMADAMLEARAQVQEGGSDENR